MPDDFSDLIPRFDLRGMDLQLDRMRHALDDLGFPCADVPAIQIAGTNGKGSIAAFLCSALLRAGIKTGLTTSPHLVTWCERIRVDGRMIAAAELRSQLIAQRKVCERNRLTPFEQLLAVAFEHFASNQVDLLVLEVGLGGRLDATTAHPKRPVIAMASIGMDHCEHLGNTLRAIATEKAAVISPGATVISAQQDPAVAEVLEATCRQQNARLAWVEPLGCEWNLGLKGVMQRSNAAVALGALHALEGLGWPVPETAIRTGFAETRWCGRLQTVHWKNLPLRIDGAHNPAAAKQLALERQSWPGEQQGVCWILGIQAHKQAIAMLRSLIKPPDQIWIVPVPGHNSWDRATLVEQEDSWAGQMHQSASSEAALKTIRAQGPWPDPLPVLAGSLYLIGDLFSHSLVTAE